MSARHFLASLRQEIEQHPALRHPVLARLESEASGRDAFSAFGLLHYPLPGLVRLEVGVDVAVGDVIRAEIFSAGADAGRHA